jgi:hypothetical protein
MCGKTIGTGSAGSGVPPDARKSAYAYPLDSQGGRVINSPFGPKTHVAEIILYVIAQPLLSNEYLRY